MIEDLLDDDCDGDFDVESVIERALLGDGAPDKPRFYCAGARRVDEDTGKKWCNYKAAKRWYGTCPKCCRPFACLSIKKGKNAETRITLGQETMDAAKALVYHPTGIPEFDKILNGGVVYERTILLGSPRGSGKTSLLLQACDGFAQGGLKSYFASGEMTKDAVVDYAKRLGIVNSNVALFGDPEGVYVDDLFDDVIAFGARFLVIDSVQVATTSDVKGDIGSPAMMDAVTNMVTSFAQRKKRAVAMIGQFEKTGNFGGSEKMQHLVDVLARMDIQYVEGEDGRLSKDVGVRKLSLDGKSRQGDAKVTSMVELTDEGIRPPSITALRALSKLKLA